MGTITVSKDVIEKLERFRRGNESLDEVLRRLIETYEEIEEYINERWENFRGTRISL